MSDSFFFFFFLEWGEYEVSGFFFFFFPGGLDLGYNRMRIYSEGRGEAI